MTIPMKGLHAPLRGNPVNPVNPVKKEEHHWEMWNIMFAWPNLTNPHPWNDVRGKRRLTQKQVDEIRERDVKENRNRLK